MNYVPTIKASNKIFPIHSTMSYIVTKKVCKIITQIFHTLYQEYTEEKQWAPSLCCTVTNTIQHWQQYKTHTHSNNNAYNCNKFSLKT